MKAGQRQAATPERFAAFSTQTRSGVEYPVESSPSNGESTTSFVLGSTCNANIETLWKSFGVPQLSSNGQLQVDALDLTPTCQAAVGVKGQF